VERELREEEELEGTGRGEVKDTVVWGGGGRICGVS